MTQPVAPKPEKPLSPSSTPGVPDRKQEDSPTPPITRPDDNVNPNDPVTKPALLPIGDPAGIA